jgi:putative addiction module component (TIGR02574 family)
MRIDDALLGAMLVAMSRDVKLLSEMLKLPAEARAALAAKLIDSLDSELDEDAEARWAAEIERRLAEVDAGNVTTIPWSEVRASILRD